MADDKHNDGKNEKKGNEIKVPPRTWLLWIGILALIPLLWKFNKNFETKYRVPSHVEFVNLVTNDQIIEGTINYNPQTEHGLNEITGRYWEVKGPGPNDRVEMPFKIKTRLLPDLEKMLWASGKFKGSEPNTLLLGVIYSLLPFILLAALIWFFLIRQLKMAGKGALSFGKSKARLLSKEKNRTTFKDVAGIEEAKEEVQELVEFLKDPKKFQKLGGRIPKGILMVGAPGTGKTLLAKAIAGEADAAFFSISGSDFVEMFVGVGASRVRDMFEQARRNTPCLIFIDEIDAVGRCRGREAILKVHAKNVKLEPTADLSVIARGTPGYSGAELANLLNEAALLAARMNKKAIGMKELEEARDKVRWGRERRSLAMTDEEKECTAWHEAGHALVNVMLEHTHPLHKVTIIPRGQSLGSTMSLPKDDVFNRRRKEMLDMIAVTMAGRIAEEIISGDISTGAAGDIQQATHLARAMVCHWGMSDKLGMVQYGENNEFVFLGREMIRSKDYSETTAEEIDTEVKRIIDEEYRIARDIIYNNRDKLEVIANCLLEYETLDGSQVEEIIRTGRFNPPPPTPHIEPPSGAQAVTPQIGRASCRERVEIAGGTGGCEINEEE